LQLDKKYFSSKVRRKPVQQKVLEAGARRAISS